jgi:hypothetical protein
VRAADAMTTLVIVHSLNFLTKVSLSQKIHDPLALWEPDISH